MRIFHLIASCEKTHQVRLLQDHQLFFSCIVLLLPSYLHQKRSSLLVPSFVVKTHSFYVIQFFLEHEIGPVVALSATSLPFCLFLSRALTVCYGAQVSKQEREKKRI
ncbi:hypothetical protein NC652_023670 [Populus alba x Populus x berolinensis]|nr:hypothetical protein NC652_023670 [Populus alba x Populus x berolinensis]